MADLINATDSLNTGRVKINAIIEDASAAVIAAESASATAGEAKITADSVQTQLDTIILADGASDAEVVQSRVDKDGKLYATLKERLDSSDAQLAETKDEVLELIGNVADGTPLFADSVPNMTDTTRIYLNTVDGYLYAHDGTSFKSTGIVYLSNSIEEYMTEENESWVI